MQAALGPTQRIEHEPRSYTLPLLLIGGSLLFLAAPWSLQHKAHLALHGLCAQTPSHTLTFDGQRLPFDARMTGIYGGFFAAMTVLVARGAYRRARLPGIPVMAVLALFVTAMAIDGFNSLFLDLLKPHLYTPDNRLRLFTGMGAGIALAVVLSFLLGVTLWRKPEMSMEAASPKELGVLVLAQAPFAVLALSGIGPVWYPVTAVLLISAVTVISLLALVCIVLFSGRECAFARPAELQRVSSFAILAGASGIALLSLGRLALEHLLGLPPLT